MLEKDVVLVFVTPKLSKKTRFVESWQYREVFFVLISVKTFRKHKGPFVISKESL